MNERIRQLAEQAGAVFEQTNGLNDCPQDSLVGDEIEKFALLLMREIAMVQITHQAGMDLENKKMDDPAKELNYAVIEHFGVGK
jgi:hypothetical protein